MYDALKNIAYKNLFNIFVAILKFIYTYKDIKNIKGIK